VATTLYPRSRLIWSLTASGLGTTLSASGNSGDWAVTGGQSEQSVNDLTPVDLRDAQDVVLMVTVGGVTGTPAFVVDLDIYDDQGNLFTAVISTASLAAAGSKTAAGGLHGSSSAYLVLPAWGRVSWSGLTGGAAVTGTEIALFGR
jgi:hypothetical protein